MSIPFSARFIDVANLVIAKGSNFLLTVILFALLTRGMDSKAFGEFGYWWSIAIMIGGVLLGGMSSAIVRVAAAHGSLRYLAGSVRGAAFALLAIGAAVSLTSLAVPQWHTTALILVAVALFGLAVQVQTALLSLLRAVEATRANALACAMIVVLVPFSLYLMLGPDSTLPTVFLFLACAFTVGTLAAIATARRRLGHLFALTSIASPGVAGFVANATSFTAISIFSYAVVNVDFTLFRLIGTPEDFALMATGKVFFERFIVPVLMVFGGAISLRVLRHRQGTATGELRLEMRLSPALPLAALAAVVVLTLAYRVFAHSIRGDTQTIDWPWVACAASGYLLYTANGILFDVLVVRRPLASVVVHVMAFLLLCGGVQVAAIRSFGVPGWALGWLVFNAAVAVVLAREGLQLRITGWGRRPSQP